MIDFEIAPYESTGRATVYSTVRVVFRHFTSIVHMKARGNIGLEPKAESKYVPGKKWTELNERPIDASLGEIEHGQDAGLGTRVTRRRSALGATSCR